MNEALKAMHMQTITEENAVKIYDALCEACEMREGCLLYTSPSPRD